MLWIFAERFFMAALRQCEKSEGCFAVFTAQPWTAAVLFKLQFSDGLLDGFFEQAMDEEAVEVPWSRVAAVLAINRLCAPGSELTIEERWYPSTALDDLLEIEEGKINDTRLYRCLDRILPHKTKLEQHLKQRYGELF